MPFCSEIKIIPSCVKLWDLCPLRSVPLNEVSHEVNRLPMTWDLHSFQMLQIQKQNTVVTRFHIFQTFCDFVLSKSVQSNLVMKEGVRTEIDFWRVLRLRDTAMEVKRKSPGA